MQPSPNLKNDDNFLIRPAFWKTKNNTHMVQISNFQDHPNTLKKRTQTANLSILTPE